MTISSSDTNIKQPIFNEMTKSIYDAQTTLSSDEFYFVDPQFSGDKPLISDSNGDIVEGTLGNGITVDNGTVNTSFYYGTCSTAAATQTKVVDCPNFILRTGVNLRVKFTNAQSYNGQAKLNVNNTGAINVCRYGTTASLRYCWYTGEVVDFVYDGTNYILVDCGLATTSYYGVTKLTNSASSTDTGTALVPSALNNALQNIVTGAAPYSSSATYAVGDYCRYTASGVTYLYKCSTAITTAHAWDASEWTAQPDILTMLNDKQDTLVSGTNIKTINNVSLLGSGNIDIGGGGGSYTAGTGIDITSGVISVDFSDVATAAQGALASTALQSGDNISVLTNNAGYITGITSSDVTTALGYTPYSNANPSGYISGIDSNMVTTALGYTPYSDANPNGYTSNVGTVTSVNNTSPDGNGNVTISVGDTLPSQTGNSGKFLTTDGTDASWVIPKTHNLFDFKWMDYTLSDQSWLCADTFSWQDGTVYSDAYNHLVDEFIPYHDAYITDGDDDYLRDRNNDVPGALNPYAWSHGSTTFYTTTETPTVSDFLYLHYDSQSSYFSITSVTPAQNINVDKVGSYYITYCLASDGHKITTDESTVANIYNESGVAWYYVLDTANQRFKLPRSTHGQIVERLTSGSQWAYVYSDGWCEQGGYIEGALNAATTVYLLKSMPNSQYVLTMGNTHNTNARSSSSSSYRGIFVQTGTIESKSTDSFVLGNGEEITWRVCGYLLSTVNNTPYQKLYFYVGQFSQSATEQTAGLNASLFNGKVDLDLNNMNPSASAKETIVDWGMPDYTAGIDISTIPLSSTPYTAPSDGIFCLQAFGSGQIAFYINGVEQTALAYEGASSSRNGFPFVVPLSKNDQVYFGSTFSTTRGCYFYPYKGV